MSKAARGRGKARERFQTVWFTLAVTFVFGTGVSFVHVATQERVQRNEALHFRQALRSAAGLSSLSDIEVATWFEEAVEEEMPGSRYAVKDPENGARIATVNIAAGAGLWGQIIAAVGMTGSGEAAQLTGLALLEQNETPGLGARIAETWFLEQMRGKQGNLKLVPEGTGSQKTDEIDGITGATITSVAVRDLLNKVLKRSLEETDDPTATESRLSDGQ